MHLIVECSLQINRRNFIKATSAVATLPLVASASFAQQQSEISPASGGQENQKSAIFKDRIKPITKDERLVRIENAKRLMLQYNIDRMLNSLPVISLY